MPTMPVLSEIQIDPATFLYEHCALPVLPEILVKLQHSLQGEEVDIDEVVYLIHSEPAMAAQVLKVVNSAYFGLPRRIGEIKMAVAYLGIKEINHILLTLWVRNTLETPDRAAFEEIWFHSIYTAFWADHLAKIFEPHLSLGELWAAAVLHDVGKLVYLKFFPDHFKALWDDSETHGRLFSESERVMGMPASSYMGILLCDRWRLPRHIKEACASHTLSDVKQAGQSLSPMTRIIALSNLIAVLTRDPLRVEIQEALAEAVKDAFELTHPDFLLLLGAANEFSLKAQHLLD